MKSSSLIRQASTILGTASLIAFAVAGNAPSAHAQAFWNLTLNSPTQTVTSGSSGTVTYTGSITNIDPVTTLTAFGDSFTTGNWNSTLNIQEATAFTNFLNGTGEITPSSSYSGDLFTVSYTGATPFSGTPFDGNFFVQTDGTPSSLGAHFTLGGTSGTSPTNAPEPASASYACFLLLAVAGGRGALRRTSPSAKS